MQVFFERFAAEVLNRGFLNDFLVACLQTGIMLGIGLSICFFVGGMLGTLLFLWQSDLLWKNKRLYAVVGGSVNLIRSFPFIILMIVSSPLSRCLVGSSIGPIAASIPLSIAGVAYFARLVELSLKDVPKSTIEACVAMGGSVPQITFRVLFVEARSGIVLGFTSLFISYLSYSAIAGIVGGGGIGDLAIRYGYYRFQTCVIIATVAFLILIVQTVQGLGHYIAAKIDHRI